MSGKHIRCVVYREAGCWQAICIDFNLACDGDSFEEVRDLLIDMIEGYLEHVAQQPVAVRRQLLARRAPWHVRAAIYTRMVRALLFSKSGPPDNQMFTQGYQLPA